jgi:hypothetical protein
MAQLLKAICSGSSVELADAVAGVESRSPLAAVSSHVRYVTRQNIVSFAS